MRLFKDKVNTAIDIYEDMTRIVNACKSSDSNLDVWQIYWDSFWELSKGFPFSVDWCDYDTSCEDDIMQRYNALTDFMESVYKIAEEQ